MKQKSKKALLMLMTGLLLIPFGIGGDPSPTVEAANEKYVIGKKKVADAWTEQVFYENISMAARPYEQRQTQGSIEIAEHPLV